MAPPSSPPPPPNPPAHVHSGAGAHAQSTKAPRSIPSPAPSCLLSAIWPQTWSPQVRGSSIVFVPQSQGPALRSHEITPEHTQGEGGPPGGLEQDDRRMGPALGQVGEGHGERCHASSLSRLTGWGRRLGAHQGAAQPGLSGPFLQASPKQVPQVQPSIPVRSPQGGPAVHAGTYHTSPSRTPRARSTSNEHLSRRAGGSQR